MGFLDFFKKNHKTNNIGKIDSFATNINKTEKDNILELKEIGILTPNCPYCNIKLNTFPQRKTKCKNCNNYIYTRQRPIDFKKVLVKEDELKLIEEEWEKNYYNKKIKNGAVMPKLEIYSYKKPSIINFVNDDDYNLLLEQYLNNVYSKKIDLNLSFTPYPYNQYNWNTLLQIIWIYQNYCKNIKQLKELGIKKVKLSCTGNCICCKSILNKEININKIVELPRTDCSLDTRICIGAIYTAVFNYND